MRLFKKLAWATVAIISAASAAAHEETVITVGRSTAGDLIVDSDFAQPVELPVSIFPGISGFATGEIGVYSTIMWGYRRLTRIRSGTW